MHPSRPSRPTEWHLVDTVTGHWCDHCLLPSVVDDTWIRVLRNDPSTVISRQVIRRCDDCGRRIPPAARGAV